MSDEEIKPGAAALREIDGLTLTTCGKRIVIDRAAAIEILEILIDAGYDQLQQESPR